MHSTRYGRRRYERSAGHKTLKKRGGVAKTCQGSGVNSSKGLGGAGTPLCIYMGFCYKAARAGWGRRAGGAGCGSKACGSKDFGVDQQKEDMSSTNHSN